jgi:hypothetical protein
MTLCRGTPVQPENARAAFFVVAADRSQLAELAQRLRVWRLASDVMAVRPLAEAPTEFGPAAPRPSGETIVQVTDSW